MRLVIPASDSTTDTRGGKMGNRGAGAAKFILAGYVPGGGNYSGTFRGYMGFDVDAAVAADIVGGWGGVRTIRGGYLQVYTRQKNAEEVTTGVYDRSIFDASADSSIRIHRLLHAPTYSAQGDGYFPDPAVNPMPQARWDDDDYTGLVPSDWSDSHWDDVINPNQNGVNRVECVTLLGEWAPAAAGGHPIKYRDPTSGGGGLKVGGNKPQRGIVIKTPKENSGSTELRFELHSTRSLSQFRPKLVMLYDPWDLTPETPRIISPKGNTRPDFLFTAYAPDTQEEEPIRSVTIEVEEKSGGSWSDVWTEEFQREADWPHGECRVENPRQPTLPVDTLLRWRLTSSTEDGTDSAPSDWQEFTILRPSPIVTPTPLGERSTMLGVRLAAEWTV